MAEARQAQSGLFDAGFMRDSAQRHGDQTQKTKARRVSGQADCAILVPYFSAFYRQGHSVDASTLTPFQLYVCAGRLDRSGGSRVGGLVGGMVTTRPSGDNPQEMKTVVINRRSTDVIPCCFQRFFHTCHFQTKEKATSHFAFSDLYDA